MALGSASFLVCFAAAKPPETENLFPLGVILRSIVVLNLPILETLSIHTFCRLDV